VKLTYLYYVLMVACFINSLYFLRDTKVKVLAILLLLSILTEICAEVNIYQKVSYYVFYHYFIIVEYALVTLLLSCCIHVKWVRNVMRTSIPVFAVSCTLIMLYLQDIKKLPSINGGIEGAVIVVWCLRAFYELRVEEHSVVFQQPSFWFILAFYIYFVTVTPFNSVFNILQEDAPYLNISTKTFMVINSLANYLLYILCIIGLYYLKRAKYMQQL